MEVSRSMMYLSPVKREKKVKEEKLKRKIEMRAELPVLDKFQIRRHRLPMYKALVAELNETGFPSSAYFLQQLVEHHEQMRQEHGPDTPVWCRKRLLESTPQLLHLCEELQKAEKANMNENYAKEFDIFIDLGVEYAMSKEDDWWWLGEQILYQCVSIGTNYRGDGGMREALARYVMGKFLLEKMKDPFVTTQIEYLGKCRKLSKGMKWSARNILKMKQDTLFVESAKLVLRALLLEAQEVKKYDPARAIQLCKIARKRASEACDRAAESEVLKLMGNCEMDCDDPKSSCESFYRSLVLNLKMGNLPEICETRILLALAYMKVENYSDALYQLETLLHFAEENKMVHYMGLAYRYLGEIYINKGQPELATPILAKAVDIFVELKDPFHRRRTKNLSAVSGGQEHLARYIQLILNCGISGAEGRDYMKKLLMWKDDRVPFWNENEVEDYNINYPEILYGAIEDKEEVIKGLKHLFHKDSLASDEMGEEEEGSIQALGEEQKEESTVESSTHKLSADTLVEEEGTTLFQNENFEEEEEQSSESNVAFNLSDILAHASKSRSMAVIFNDEDFDDEDIEKAHIITIPEEESAIEECELEQEEYNIPLDLPEIEAFQGEEEYVESEYGGTNTNITEAEPEELAVGEDWALLEEQEVVKPEEIKQEEVKPEEIKQDEVKPEEVKAEEVKAEEMKAEGNE